MNLRQIISPLNFQIGIVHSLVLTSVTMVMVPFNHSETSPDPYARPFASAYAVFGLRHRTRLKACPPGMLLLTLRISSPLLR
jgi:hypothetical protein